MHKHRNDQLEWLTFDLLSDCPRVVHGSFTRHGGTSSGPFASLNLDSWKGDDPECVNANLNLVKKALAIPELRSVHQIHGVEILEVHAQQSNGLKGYDALLTNAPQIGLMIKHADCQAAIFYDPVHHAAANVHSGWRGSVKNIYHHVIETMKKTYQTQPEDLLVCISPSLGPDAAEFIHFRQELPEAFWEFQVKPNYFDFWAISEMQLKNCGILSHHIEIAGLCTFTNENDFYSYRRTTKRGLSEGHGTHGTIVMLT